MEDLANCQHCKMTGTSANGENGTSCKRCAAEWQTRYPKKFIENQNCTGLVCSVCWGKGFARPDPVDRADQRMPVNVPCQHRLVNGLATHRRNVGPREKRAR